jgi:hypothetical protein
MAAMKKGLSALSCGECQRRTGFRVVGPLSQDGGKKVPSTHLALAAIESDCCQLIDVERILLIFR